MAVCQKIIIAGFSGAGKSTLLRQLRASPQLGFSLFDDLDALVLKACRPRYSRLSDLIEKEGWDRFRLLERQTFEGWIKEEEKGVLSLGGGTLSPLLLELYARHPRLRFCYLVTPFEECWSRLVNDHEEPRPLVQRGQAELHRIYLERERLFEQIPWRLDGTLPMEQLAKQLWAGVSPE